MCPRPGALSPARTITIPSTSASIISGDVTDCPLATFTIMTRAPPGAAGQGLTGGSSGTALAGRSSTASSVLAPISTAEGPSSAGKVPLRPR